MLYVLLGWESLIQFAEREVLGDGQCGDGISWGFWVGISQVISQWVIVLIVLPISFAHGELVSKPKARALRAAGVSGPVLAG